MVAAKLISRVLKTVDSIPDWAAMSWQSPRILDVISRLPPDVGEAATEGVTVDMCRDWSPEGAATMKARMRRMVEDSGRLGRFGFCDGTNAGFEKMHNELLELKTQSDAVERDHCNRTKLPVERVRELVLFQHSANDRNLLFSFFTDPSTRTVLTVEWALVDMEFNMQTVRRMSQSIIELMHDARRVVLSVDSPVQTPWNVSSPDAKINFYLNDGRDAEMLFEYKAFLVSQVGFAEASIDLMLDVFHSLPAGAGKMKLQRDPQTSALSFFVDNGHGFVPLVEHLEAKSGITHG